MIIYIVGYGRSGSTVLSRAIEEKLNAVNLGEVKYLYRTDKDDLLHPYWLDFKRKNKDLFYNSSFEFFKYDSIFGFFLRDGENLYCQRWHEIFKNMGLNPDQDIIIDNSKTPLDSVMRGIRLRNCYDEVLFVQPKRKFPDIVRSLFKGKNSNIERGERKSWLGRIWHTVFVGLPHLLVTLLLSQIYRIYDLKMIDLKNLECELEEFIENNALQRRKTSKELPMIYGNRSRKRG